MGGNGGKLSGAGGGGFLFEIINEKYQQQVFTALGEQKVIKIAYEPFGTRLLSQVF
jgi:galactokinase/mevalonate kinase-like predicted kinase